MKIDKKTIIWSLPILVAGGYGIYLLISYFKEKSGINPNATKKPNPPKPRGEIKDDGTASSSFPLKKGVTNDYVKQLQSILDVTPQSGYFGNLTYAALQEQTGKTQIDSLDELNSVIDTIISNDNIPQKTSKANNIISTYNNLMQKPNSTTMNGASNIDNSLLFLKDTTLYTDGFVMYISQNKTLSLNDYIPTYVDTNGNLVLICNKGNNAATWTVDPTNISIQ
jgi:hypothetical protein